jgi:hypothetical protein
MRHFGVHSIGVALVFLFAARADPQPPTNNRPKTAVPPSTVQDSGPRLVPVAETKLVMEGIAQANFQGLERILKNKEIDDDSWSFARGQALLIAESGNLLMLRPPKNAGEDSWMKLSSQLRESSTNLARVVASRDVERSRKGLTDLANVCNRCHQNFQVKTRITAFAPAKP